MTKTKCIYERFEGFEEQVAHCYFLLHERFIANPPLAKFWADSAMEELEHFSLLRFCREKNLMSGIDLDGEVVDTNLDDLKSSASPATVICAECGKRNPNPRKAKQ